MTILCSPPWANLEPYQLHMLTLIRQKSGFVLSSKVRRCTALPFAAQAVGLLGTGSRMITIDELLLEDFSGATLIVRSLPSPDHCSR